MSDEMIRSWVALGCLAPSPHNNQPWLVSIENKNLWVRLDPRYLPALGPDRLQFMALGAFIENVAYAAAADGFEMRLAPVPVVPSRGTELALSFEAVAQGADAAARVDAARRRRTNRGSYLSELPTGALDSLESLVPEDGTTFVLLGDGSIRETSARLAGRAMEIVFTLPELRADLAPYVFTSADPPVDVGMPLASMSPAARDDVSGRRWAMELADAGEEAAAARARFDDAPVHFVVTARTDTLPGWIAAGRTLQRALVTAASLGLAHCLAAGPCEVPTLVAELRGLLPSGAGRPMLLGRVGVPVDPGLSLHAPRRAVSEVVSGRPATSEPLRANGGTF
jgi:hypothetical protein